MNKRAEITARQIVMTLLISTALLVGVFTFISAFVPSGSEEQYTIYNSSLSAKFEAMNAQSNSIVSPVKDAQPQEQGQEGILGGLINSGWSSIKLTWAALTIGQAAIDESGRIIGVDSWVTNLMIALLFVALAFALMAAWFKWYI